MEGRMIIRRKVTLNYVLCNMFALAGFFGGLSAADSLSDAGDQLSVYIVLWLSVCGLAAPLLFYDRLRAS